MPSPVLYSGHKIVAKRFDHMIGRHRDVRGPAFDHAQHRGENAPHRSHLPALFIPR